MKDLGPVGRLFWFGVVPLVVFVIIWSVQPWFGGGGFDEADCLADIKADRLLDDECAEYWAKLVLTRE